MISFALFSQDGVNEKNNLNSSPLIEATGSAERGTYQIIIDNVDFPVNITRSMLLQIEDIRHSEDIKYIILNKHAKIKILPLKTINDKDFVPVKKFSYEE